MGESLAIVSASRVIGLVLWCARVNDAYELVVRHLEHWRDSLQILRAWPAWAIRVEPTAHNAIAHVRSSREARDSSSG